MEIISVASPSVTNSTLVKNVDKGQTVDTFSELLAMLFSNMLISDSNQYNQTMDQNNIANLNGTAESTTEIADKLSIMDNLRISGNQPGEKESIQKLLNGNSILNNILCANLDFQKLLYSADNIPDELKEFINNINNFSSTETESLGTMLNTDTVELISEQLNRDMTNSEVTATLGLNNIQKDQNTTLSVSDEMLDTLNIKTEENITASEAKAILDLNNIQKDENTTPSASNKISDTLNAQVKENTSVSEPKQISGTLNAHTADIKAEKSSMEAANVLNNSSKINYADKIESIIETSTDEKNNFTNNQGETKSLKPEGKLITTLETANNFEQVTGLNTVKNENMNMVTQQDKFQESTLIKNPQDIIDITIEKFKTLKLPGSTEVTVKLRPEELGEVSLKLVLEKGQINGSITAERKEVVFMLQNNLDQLKTDLKNNNVNLNSISVNIQAGEDFNNNSRRGFSNKQYKNNNKVVQAFEEETQSYDFDEGLNIIA